MSAESLLKKKKIQQGNCIHYNLTKKYHFINNILYLLQYTGNG